MFFAREKELSLHQQRTAVVHVFLSHPAMDPATLTRHFARQIVIARFSDPALEEKFKSVNAAIEDLNINNALPLQPRR